MARSKARHGFSTTLGYNAWAVSQPGGTYPTLPGLTYTALAEIKNIKGPTVTIGTSDITHLSSDSGYKEFLAGFFDGGEVTLSVNFLEETLDGLLSELTATSGVLGAFKITLPLRRDQSAATVILFTAIITALPFPDVPEDGPIMGEITLKVTGAVTHTAGTLAS